MERHPHEARNYAVERPMADGGCGFIYGNGFSREGNSTTVA